MPVELMPELAVRDGLAALAFYAAMFAVACGCWPFLDPSRLAAYQPRDRERLTAELGERLAKLGYDGEVATALAAWAGTENLEERVRGVDRIDPVVLEQLRGG